MPEKSILSTDSFIKEVSDELDKIPIAKLNNEIKLSSQWIKDLERQLWQVAEVENQICKVLCSVGLLLQRIGSNLKAKKIYQKIVHLFLDPSQLKDNYTKTLIVFLHNNNDLDHITPVIFKWVRKINSRVIVLWAPDGNIDHRNCNDLIQYLINLTHVCFIELNIYVEQTIYLSQKYYENDCLTYDMVQYGLAYTIIENYLSSSRQGVFVADHYITLTTCGFCVAAKKMNIKCVSLPHSEAVILPYNRKIKSNDLSVNKLKRGHAAWNWNKKTFGYFNYVVFPCKMNAEGSGYIPTEKKIILGSARNSSEWINELSGVIPKIKIPNADKKLKIVLFIPSEGYIINIDEIINTIKMIMNFPDIFLIVKLHPRETNFEKRLSHEENLMQLKNTSYLLYMGNNIYTPLLVEWGDIFLTIATGVSYQILRYKKPVLELSYLMGFKTVLTEFFPVTDIRTRDMLIELIWIFKKMSQKERTHYFYDLEELNAFLSFFLEPSGKSVLDNYVNFLSGLC